MAEYIDFKEVTNGEKKTKKIHVTSKQGATLGFIKFWGAWRQYTFRPCKETIFDTKCLKEITDEIERMNVEIRAEWSARRLKSD